MSDEQMKEMITAMLEQVSANIQAMSDNVLSKLEAMGDRVATLESTIHQLSAATNTAAASSTVSSNLQFGVCPRVHNDPTYQCSFQDNTLRVVATGGSLPMYHAEQCPLQHSGSQWAHPSKVVRPAVSVLLHCADRVLLTRRPSHMRSFPCVWVLPGGSIDADESLAEAVTRELHEETGIVCQQSHLSLLCLYESVHPIHADVPPSHHHLIVYYSGVIEEMQKITPQPEEVDAWTWITAEHARMIVSQQALDDECESVDAVEHGEPTRISLKRLQALPDSEGKYPLERVSTGTKVALREWLKSLTTQ